MKGLQTFVVAGIGLVAQFSFCAGVKADPVVIGGQTFNDLEAAERRILTAVSDGEELKDSATSYEGGEFGLGFTSRWFRTRQEHPTGPNVQGSDQDTIGVNASALDDSSRQKYFPHTAADGTPVEAGVEQNYVINEPDGRLDLIFESVDISNFRHITVTLDYWFYDETARVLWPYLIYDRLAITLNDGVSSETALELIGNDLLAISDDKDTGVAPWKSFQWEMESSSLSGDSLQVTVSFDGVSQYQNFAVDNLKITGEPANVPEPSAAALIIAGLLPWLLRGRRRQGCVASPKRA